MESALSWIGQLVDWLGSLLPRLRVVHRTHNAVFMRGGCDAVVRGPGLYVIWPIVTTAYLVSRMREVEVVSTEPTATADDVTVRIAVNITFHISDPYVYVVENADSDDSLDDIAAAAVAAFVMSTDYDYLRSCMEEELDGLVEEVQGLVTPFGVTVETARITGVARTRVITLDQT